MEMPVKKKGIRPTDHYDDFKGPGIKAVKVRRSAGSILSLKIQTELFEDPPRFSVCIAERVALNNNLNVKATDWSWISRPATQQWLQNRTRKVVEMNIGNDP